MRSRLNHGTWYLCVSLMTVVFSLAGPLHAGGEDEVIWEFIELATHGEDVQAMAGPVINTNAAEYDFIFQIMEFEVEVTVGTVIFWIDVTSQLPADLLYGEGVVEGPAPVDLQVWDIAYPEPPDDPTASGHVVFSINEDGYGVLSVSEVFLDEYEGMDLTGCRLTCIGNVIASGEAPPPNPADVDGDGSVGFSDLLAVLSSWGNTGGAADVDGDGTVGFGDVLAVLSSWG